MSEARRPAHRRQALPPGEPRRRVLQSSPLPPRCRRRRDGRGRNCATSLTQELADDHGIPYIRDLDEALARSDVHIVSMCARIERRGVVAVKCAEAGKHVYLDKPLCGSVEAADAVVEAMDKAGVVNQMYCTVHSGWVQRAKHAIDSGALGTLRAIHCEELFAKGPPGTAPGDVVRQEKERHADFTFPESKREMFDIGVYPLTVIHWLTGRKAESVTALTGNYFFAEHIENDTEDFGAISMQLEGGISASIIAGRFGYMSHPGRRRTAHRPRRRQGDRDFRRQPPARRGLQHRPQLRPAGARRIRSHEDVGLHR